jgi:fructose-1,6-bisphosphatase/inositol monophosphatase family enzyme
MLTASLTDRIGDLMRTVAAEEIMPRFRRLEDAEIWRKRAGSLVTVADEASEQRLRAALTGFIPGSVTLGEEEAEADPSAFGRLSGEAPVWIIDPLDGTANFAAGKTRFAVIVALSVGGRVRAGWILDPVNDALVSAEEGAGAWRDETRLGTAAAGPPAAMRGSLISRLRRDPVVCNAFAAVIAPGSCGVNYIDLAAGVLDFAFYRRLEPWDHAAGDLIHREAGGRAACLDGTPYDPVSPGETGLLLAADEAAWSAIAAVIGPAIAAPTS